MRWVAVDGLIPFLKPKDNNELMTRTVGLLLTRIRLARIQRTFVVDQTLHANSVTAGIPHWTVVGAPRGKHASQRGRPGSTQRENVAAVSYQENSSTSKGPRKSGKDDRHHQPQAQTEMRTPGPGVGRRDDSVKGATSRALALLVGLVNDVDVAAPSQSTTHSSSAALSVSPTP